MAINNIMTKDNHHHSHHDNHDHSHHSHHHDYPYHHHHDLTMTMIVGLAIYPSIYLSICLSIHILCYAMSYDAILLLYITIPFYSICVYVSLCLWKREVVELTSWDLQFLCLPAHVFRRMIGASSAAWHLLLTFGAINKHGPCVPIYSWDHQYSILATSNNTWKSLETSGKSWVCAMLLLPLTSFLRKFSQPRQSKWKLAASETCHKEAVVNTQKRLIKSTHDDSSCDKRTRVHKHLELVT